MVKSDMNDNALRLLTFACSGEIRLGALMGEHLVDLNRANPKLPPSLNELVVAGGSRLDLARSTVEQIAKEFALNAAEVIGKGKVYPLAEVRVLAPFPRPKRNVFCVGRNYLKHVAEAVRRRGVEFRPPEYPEFFTKPPATVVGSDAPFPLDQSLTVQLDYEGELAVVMGAYGRDIEIERAYDYVFGYTIGNDISARDVQQAHGQWFKGKALDNSCPLGPVVVPHRDVGDPPRLALRLRVNGETRQDSNTAEMYWGVAEIIYWLSRGTTLEPGDIILTGTPGGVGSAMIPPRFLKPGDVIEAEIEGIGVLRTHIVSR